MGLWGGSGERRLASPLGGRPCRSARSAPSRPSPTRPPASRGQPFRPADKISGAKAERPGLALALEVARAGDTLVVWRLDRLGGGPPDPIPPCRELRERGV